MLDLAEGDSDAPATRLEEAMRVAEAEGNDRDPDAMLNARTALAERGLLVGYTGGDRRAIQEGHAHVLSVPRYLNPYT
jgi:hypothetical protein